jgi:hypothetical protein
MGWPVQQVTRGADVEGLTGVAGRALLAQTVARLLNVEEPVTTGSGPTMYCTAGSLPPDRRRSRRTPLALHSMSRLTILPHPAI